MKKTLIIIKREYLSRVKKRSFIVMTILGPLLMAALMIVPYYITKLDKEQKIINVLDETGIYNKLGSNETIKFNYIYTDIETAIANFDQSNTSALLYIPKPSLTEPTNAILYFADKQPGNTVTSYIQDKMKYIYENKKLMELYGIDKKQIDEAKVRITINSENIKTGEKNLPLATTLIGIFAGFLIYFSIFMYGNQVMRGVIEEKTSRIVEIIVSSVKPFQLLLGKIVGIALVGLTQFLLWIVLTLSIVTVFQMTIGHKNIVKTEQTQITKQSNTLFPENPDMKKGQDSDNEMIQSLLNSIGNYNYTLIIASFFFFFLFGYLLYAALFAAIGSAVDNEADTQQFMLPITIPLILAFILAQPIIENPQGPIAFWFSIIPLTSPIVMMIRLPFGVPVYELILSMGLLVFGFIFCTWLAAKIYRTGILMYGKKISYRELWKWLRY
ncbi:MAG TPA: ABC transporter permease [Bacteroidales bacterium]|nr:ABC transporter permease [Bacteroidales bacterium]